MFVPNPDPALLPPLPRLERLLGRIMRRIDGARELRSWVEREVGRARDAAAEGLHDLRGRWDAELTRLQGAEKKLLRLQEQVGGTRLYLYRIGYPGRSARLALPRSLAALRELLRLRE